VRKKWTIDNERSNWEIKYAGKKGKSNPIGEMIWMGYLRDKIAEMMHLALVDAPEKGTPPAKSVAKAANIGYWALMKKMEPEGNQTTLEDFILLYHASEGALQDVLRYIVSECEPGMYLGEAGGFGKTDGSFDDDVRKLTSQLGKVADAVELAYKDDGIISDRDEEEKISKSLDGLQNAIDVARRELYRIREMRKAG
jgi:hypothetical protein